MLGLSIQRLQKIPKILIGIFILLFLLNLLVIIVYHCTDHYLFYGLYLLLFFDYEMNLPTFFSTFILLLSSLLSYFVYKAHKKSNLNDSKYWLVLSILFLLFSLDEFITVHETLMVPFREIFNITSGFLYFAWVIPGIIICLILLAYFLKFYLNLPPRYRLFFGISALLFIFGVIGMEIINGYFFTEGKSPSLLYRFLTTIEESTEMIGVIIFIGTILDYINSDIQTVNYEIS